jgi:hypothetical protein
MESALPGTTRNCTGFCTDCLHPGLTGVHTLRLANAADLWYSGGGAFQPKTFGYTGRPSNGNRGLANVWDLSADYQITRSFSTTLYYGHAWGKGVISSIYPKDANGQLIFLETNFHF